MNTESPGGFKAVLHGFLESEKTFLMENFDGKPGVSRKETFTSYFLETSGQHLSEEGHSRFTARGGATAGQENSGGRVQTLWDRACVETPPHCSPMEEGGASHLAKPSVPHNEGHGGQPLP